MKQPIVCIIASTFLSFIIPSSLWAAHCTDINYCNKRTTVFGTEYESYVVRCSDGSKREITAWEKRKKWCVGTTNQCADNQMKAAEMACKKSS